MCCKVKNVSEVKIALLEKVLCSHSTSIPRLRYLPTCTWWLFEWSLKKNLVKLKARWFAVCHCSPPCSCRENWWSVSSFCWPLLGRHVSQTSLWFLWFELRSIHPAGSPPPLWRHTQTHRWGQVADEEITSVSAFLLPIDQRRQEILRPLIKERKGSATAIQVLQQVSEWMALLMLTCCTSLQVGLTCILIGTHKDESTSSLWEWHPPLHHLIICSWAISAFPEILLDCPIDVNFILRLYGSCQGTKSC